MHEKELVARARANGCIEIEKEGKRNRCVALQRGVGEESKEA